MQGQPIGMEDPLFQQIFGCYVGTQGTGTTEQRGRSDDDRYFDDEAFEEEEKQEEQILVKTTMEQNFYI